MTSVERLFGFQLELETELRAQHVTDIEVRDMMAIARGHLELARDYAVPLAIAAVETHLARVAELVLGPKAVVPFLIRLRRTAGLAAHVESFAA
jgi:hypothetical protein